MMRPGVRPRAAGLVLLAATVVLAACGSGQGAASGGAGAGSSAPASAGSSAPASGAAPPAAGEAAPSGRAAYPLASDPEVKVHAAWCAVAGAMFPLWVAKEAGIFQRHKLDVDIQLIQGGDTNMAALMRGEVDFIECAGGSLIPGIMAGADALLVANLYQGNPYRLIVVPEVQTMADLRGRKLAISRPGDYDNRLVEVMLERNGLVANQDVTLVPVGGQTDRYNALKGGIVDGTTVNPPVNLTAQNAGYREIFNLGDLGISSVYISLFTSRNVLQSRPRLVERFIAAMVEASAYAKANREYTINLMGDYLKLTDRAALEGAYQAFAVETLAIPPYVPVDAVQAVMDETLRINPNATVRDATTIVDNKPLQAVEASGFINAVKAELLPGQN